MRLTRGVGTRAARVARRARGHLGAVRAAAPASLRSWRRHGLTQRAIRRACGGRESASLYHRAKYLQLAVLGLGGLALLMWPGPVHWQLCVPLGALVTGGLASVQWAYYKKHM